MAKKQDAPQKNIANVFTKEQLLKAKDFTGLSDVLAVVLEEKQTYTVEQAQKLANDFLKRRVK